MTQQVPVASLPSLYGYRFDIFRVIDGDTVQAVVDLGFHKYETQMLRLLGVDTPEIRPRGGTPESRMEEGALAWKAKDWVEDWVHAHREHNPHKTWGGHPVQPLLGWSEHGDSFGRWIVNAYCADGHSLSADLLEAGIAVPYPHG
jgi:endonuclease YncB( thermonuclease family)